MMEYDDYVFDNGKDSLAEIYKVVLSRVRKQLVIDYIYHICRLEGSMLPLHVARRILLGKSVDGHFFKKYKFNDITLATNTIRGMKFAWKIIRNPEYKITVSDVRNIFT